MKNKIAILIYLNILVFSFTSCKTNKQTVELNVDFEKFVSRHDMVWDRTPDSWTTAPFSGNGNVGFLFYQIEGGPKNAMSLHVGRHDYYDHRLPYEDQQMVWIYRTRLPLGHFNLESKGEIIGADLRLGLWDAELTGTITTTLGSCSESQTQTINIAETPAPSFTTNSPQCEGADLNITYTGTSDPNWTYLWDLGVGSTPSSATQQNPQSILYSGAGSKTIFLTVTNGLCSESTSASISIDALPIANAGFDTTICADMSVMIGSASVAGNTYSWAPGSTLDDVAISAPTASPDANNTEYIVLVTNTSTGCSNSDSITVLMQDPLIANANIDGEICYGDSFQIGTGLIEGQDYVWTPSAGLSDPTLPNPISTPDSTTVYTLAVSGGGCGPVMDEVTIIVHPLPLANAGIDDTITTGSSTQLIATGGVQYEWNPFYALDNSGVFNPIASPSTTTEYSVIVTDIYGCVNSDTVVVFVIEPSFWLPNGFTPDGNGNNDILYVRGEGITDFQFRIFNKWGELIFYTNKLEEGWNGHRLLSDEAMPVGAYVYHVSGVLSNGEPVITEGIVNLIR